MGRLRHGEQAEELNLLHDLVDFREVSEGDPAGEGNDDEQDVEQAMERLGADHLVARLNSVDDGARHAQPLIWRPARASAISSENACNAALPRKSVRSTSHASGSPKPAETSTVSAAK